MLGKLDDELRIKLQLVSTFIGGQYNAVQAAIINRTDGTVDKHSFSREFRLFDNAGAAVYLDDSVTGGKRGIS